MQFIAKLIRFWVILVFLALTGYVAIHNQDRVTLRLPPVVTQINAPVYGAFMVAFLTGAGIVCFFFGIEHMKKNWTIRQLNKRLQSLEKSSPPNLNAANQPYVKHEGPTL